MVSKLEKLESFDNAHRRILATHPEFAAYWERFAQRRKLSEFLLRARFRTGLTQSQIAERAGWDKSFVSRLESVSSPIPDLATISRYMLACGETVGLAVWNSTDPERSPVVDAFLLNNPEPKQAATEAKVKASAEAKS